MLAQMSLSARVRMCVSVTLAYWMWICMHYAHASADEQNPSDYDFAQLHSKPYSPGLIMHIRTIFFLE